MNDSSDSTDQNADTDAPEHRADEIEQLRERLSFYESFDQLIQDNITRAATSCARPPPERVKEISPFAPRPQILSSANLPSGSITGASSPALLDEITIVQQNVERLARQVADALDDLEAVIPAAGEPAGIESDQFPSMPTFSTGSAGNWRRARPQRSRKRKPGGAGQCVGYLRSTGGNR